MSAVDFATTFLRSCIIIAAFCLMVFIFLCLIVIAEICLESRGKNVTPDPSLPPPRPSKSSLSELPVELVHMVSGHLPLTSKLCLALSSKSLLSLLDPTADLQQCSDLRYPMASYGWYRRFPSLREKNVFNTYRWKLLRELEDSRFRCCSGCLKLHPVSEFSALDIETVAERRTCMFGRRVGVVDLCRCLRMTFRDKVKLAAHLAKTNPGGAKDGILGSNDFCWHQCSDTYGLVTVHTTQTPKLEANGNLSIDCLYTVTGTDLSLQILCIPVHCCSHRTIMNYFFDVICLQFGSRPPGSVNDQEEGAGYRTPVKCQSCWTTYFDPIWSLASDRHTYVRFSFRTRRNLGSDNDRADRIWYGHTDVASEEYYLGPTI